MFSVDDLKDPKSEYYKEALEWHNEKFASANKRSRLGWIFALLFAFLCACFAMALAGIMPLKEVHPYTIEVNQLTGETRVATPLKDGRLTQSEALTKYWLVKYVRARVGYDRLEINDQYKQVRMMTTAEEFNRYAALIKQSNPKSPLNVYGDNGRAHVEIKSISLAGKNKDRATIRLDIISEQDVGSSRREPWIINTTFKFTLEPRTELERFDNPLGFLSDRWRIDPEILTGEGK